MDSEALEAWRVAQRGFCRRGHGIVFRRAGAGEALLLIHGFPTAGFDYARLWPHLAGRFDLIAPDLLGFGFSDRPRRYRYSIFDQTDLIESLLGALGIRSLHILAHDYGDSIAQEMLARARERAAYPEIRSVLLLNGGLFYSAIRFSPMQRLLRSPFGVVAQHLMGRRSFGRSFGAIFGPRTRPDPAELDAFWRLVTARGGKGAIHALMRYLDERRANEARWSMALAETPVPLALVYGDADPISGTPIAERLAEVAPRARIARLAGIGHYPQVEAPDAVLAALDALHARSPR